LGLRGHEHVRPRADSGLHLALTGELLKREKTRAGAWVTSHRFVAPHIDLRLDVMLRQERQSMLLSQMQVYL
jgi:hypothetical protein